MPKKLSHWLITLVSGAVSGGANAALANFGPSVINAGAAAVGITAKMTIHHHEWDELIDQFLSGAVVGAIMFLAKSPISDAFAPDTQPFARSQTPNPTDAQPKIDK